MFKPKISTNKLFAEVCRTSIAFKWVLEQQKNLALPIPKHYLKESGIVE